jgi:hypothetical protein
MRQCNNKLGGVMAFAAEQDRPRLVELGNVPEFWADGIGKIEDLGGGTYRLLLYKVHRPLDGEGPVEHEVVAAVLVNLAMVSSILPALRLLVCRLRNVDPIVDLIQ